MIGYTLDTKASRKAFIEKLVHILLYDAKIEESSGKDIANAVPCE